MIQLYIRRAGSLAAFAMLLAGGALAQIDLSGNWGAMFTEDQPERIPGPELGDYLGLPVNDANRLRADSWSGSRITMPDLSFTFSPPPAARLWE